MYVLLLFISLCALWWWYKYEKGSRIKTHKVIRQNDDKMKKLQKQEYDERYIGAYMNAGVIYDQDFKNKEREISIEEPSSYTPYPEDYVRIVTRPLIKQLPSY